MERLNSRDDPRKRREYLGLAGLILGLAFGAGALGAVAGPPRLPQQLPGWDTAAFTLRSSYLPLEVLAYVLTTAAWVVWVWIVASLVFRLVVIGAETVTGGASWVAGLRAVSDRVTLPIVRRLVDGALVAILVVNLVGRSTPSAAAAVLTATATVTLVAAQEEASSEPASWESQRDHKARVMEYSVEAGDTLWGIAERFYGTGHEYPRLVADNAGRQMPDGRRFTQAGVIHPGWVLLIRPAREAVEDVSGQAYYVVREGDTLRGIAARLVKDESRWPEIFELNAGTAELEDGRVLKDPGLIWPGLRLQLPFLVPAGDREAPEPGPAAQPAEAEPVSPVAPFVAETTPTVIPTSPKGQGDAEEPPIVLTPEVVVEPEPAPAEGVVSPLVSCAVGLSVAGAVGGAVLLARRRVRRNLRELPVRAVPAAASPPGGDFAEAEFGRVLTHRLHGEEVEPVVLVAQHALRFLEERGMSEVTVVMAQQGRNVTTLALNLGLLDQTRLLDLAGELGIRLGGTGQASLTPDHDVTLQLSRLKLAGLRASPSHGLARPVHLLPLGVLPGGSTLYANWPELGHVLVAGIPGGGTEVVLASMISALAARCRPEALRLWTIADRRLLPEQLLRLPHQSVDLVDPTDESAVGRTLQQVRTELIRRMRDSEREDALQRSAQPGEPDLVLVIGELGSIEDDGTTLELIGVHGAAHGVRLVASTTRPADLAVDLLAHFRTQLVLQTLDEEESIRLLGRPDAADLETGDLLLRLDGRIPVRARGFRVSSDRLDELVGLMRQAYGFRAPATEGRVAAPGDPEGSLTRPVDRDDSPEGSGRGPATDRVTPSLDPASEGGGRPRELEDHDEPEEAEEPTRSAEEEGGEDTDLERLTPAEVAAVKECRSKGRQDQTTPLPTAWTDEDVLRTSEVEADEQPHSGHREDTMPGDTVVVDKELPDGEEVIAEAASLVEIRCFGEFVVRSGGREITPSSEEGASFKAWEVLAFLAAHPEGAVSKERLLAAVWPDVDADRAGNRMRVAMVRLRALLARQVPGLPSEAVRADRDGTCRLDTTLISSDVHQFVTLCRTAAKFPPEEAKSALQRARAAYGGDLLPGRGSRFYEWVDERDESGVSLRESYREEYYRVTQRLARSFCREGRPDLAVPLYRGLLKAEPTLEDLVRELYRCYQQLGDLSSLIREDRHLRQSLREAYYDPDDPEDDPNSYQPEPETVELFTTIRRELEAAGRARAVKNGRLPSGVIPGDLPGLRAGLPPHRSARSGGGE